MTEPQTITSGLLRNLLVAAKEEAGIAHAKKAIQNAGYKGFRDLLENGRISDWHTAASYCAWLLAFLPYRELPFVPPPMQIVVRRQQSSREWAAMRRAAELRDTLAAKARELGCVVLGEEIHATPDQAAELNRYWTEIYPNG